MLFELLKSERCERDTAAALLSFRLRFNISLCWILGTSVLRKRPVFRTDVPSSQHSSFRQFWLRTSLLVGTIVLQLIFRRFNLLGRAGTVYSNVCKTFGIEEFSSDASLTDWGQVYVVF